MSRTVKRRFLKPIVWLALALPGVMMTVDLARGAVLPMDLLHPTGELSVRLMILAMLAGPVAGIFGPNRFTRGWLGWRRNLGVAAFAYGVLHLFFYLIDMGLLAAVLDELTLPSIWTGWLALAMMLVPAAISFDQAMIGLGRRLWKGLQRLVWPGLLLSLTHWLLLDWKWQPAVVHLAPLLIAWSVLGLRRFTHRNSGMPA